MSSPQTSSRSREDARPADATAQANRPRPGAGRGKEKEVRSRQAGVQPTGPQAAVCSDGRNYSVSIGRFESARQQEAAEASCMVVDEGERMHQVVVVSLSDGSLVTVMAKRRLSDGGIKAMVRIEPPSGPWRILRPKAWTSVAQFDEFVGSLLALHGGEGIRVIRGEDIEANVSRVAGDRGAPTRTAVGRRREGRPGHRGRDRSPGPPPAPRGVGHGAIGRPGG